MSWRPERDYRDAEVMKAGDLVLPSDPTRLRGELARLRADAARSQGLLDAILEQSPHGIIVSVSRGELVLQNRGAEKIWGGPRSRSLTAASRDHRHRAAGRLGPWEWNLEAGKVTE